MKPLAPLEVSLEGTTLIEASAGTGKTYTIATLYLRLLLEAEWTVEKILVVTYTRAATAELRDRIRRRIAEAAQAFESGEAADDAVLQDLLARFDAPAERARATRNLNGALANFDEAAILTIHGFCQRALREHAFESRAAFDVDLLVDQNALLRDIVNDFWSQTVARESEIVVRFLLKEHRGIDSLMQVAAHGAVAAPPRVLPEAPRYSPRELDALANDWQVALDEAGRLWTEQGEEVLELLAKAADEGRLNKGSYNPEKIRSIWKGHTDALLVDRALPIADREIIKRLARLGPDGLSAKTNKGKTTPHHPLFEACARLLELDAQLLRVLLDRQSTFERELIEAVERELETRKRELTQQSYDDLLAQMARALEGPGGDAFVRELRKDYGVALVDEFQDTDQLQYHILRRVWHRDDATLFLIGDPKQAIYAFRGADVQAYLDAKRDAGGRCFTLDTNWRSDPRMIEGVAALFRRIDDPFLVEGIGFEEVRARPNAIDVLGDAPALEVLFYPRPDEKPASKQTLESDLPWRIAADIAATLQAGIPLEGRPVEPGDIAVLCRTNDQTRAICDALRGAGIPAALLGTANVFDSPEARELQSILDAVATRATSRIRAALTTSLFGLTAEDIGGALEEEASWDRRLADFARWHALWTQRGFIRMFHQLVRDSEAHVRLLGLEGGERRLTNFLHLAELAERAALDDHLGPVGLVTWLARMRADRALRGNVVGEEGELRLETDAYAVKVVTVHKSKGLEYPIVYCPFLHASTALPPAAKARVRFHDAERGGEITLDVGSADHDAHVEIAEEESLAENMRMLYVALTRARHRCSIVWGGIRKAEESGLFRLLHAGTADARTFKKLADEEIRVALGDLAAESNGAVGLRDLPSEAASHSMPDMVDRAFRPAEASRVHTTRWQHSSFSQLAASEREARPVMPPAREEGLDYDAVREPAPLGAAEPAASEIRFAALPPGAATGTLLHAVLEHLDFEQPALAQFEGRIAEILDSNGVGEGEREGMARDLDRVRETRWSDDGPMLAEIPRSRRLDELEFLLPVAGGASASARRGVGMRSDMLASVLREHATDDFQRAYAERVAALRFDALAGYLKGFVDLAFEWQGRFYLVDYKSNHLGVAAADYRPAALERPMAEHHYVLQYHLYAVALDRYLGRRLPDYDYQTHFGGIYYLFLRGMDPSHPTGCGIFRHRPTRDGIDALSRLLEDPGALAA